MPRSNRSIVENKCKNPVYSEILLKINTRSVDAFTFAEEFNKSRPAVVMQLHELEKDGLLEKTDHPQRLKNKKYYTINWRAILHAFWDYCQSIQQISIPKKYYHSQPLEQFFQALFAQYAHLKSYPTIEKIFQYTLYSPLASLLKPGKSDQSKEILEIAEFLSNFYYDKTFEQAFVKTINGMNKQL